ncbi:MAG: protein kinase, partial [Gemmatimonadaceae bacterium]|nr:protein kinase [Gemmatimonadaceae bacterium]
AHERGVVHRDIKPDNVMLTGGAAVVADFGIAKALAASRARQDLGGTRAPTLTQLGTSIGTPTYMAPEQAAGDPGTDHRADLYALGCVGYELLAGHPPFHGLSPQRLLAAHMGEEPRPIGELRPDSPPLLADLIMRCLAKDPDARPGQASDIVRVLETVTSGSGYDAMPAVLLGGRGMTRRALTAWGIALVVAMLLATVATTEIGLPTWVVPGTALVMLLGLPVILATSYVQRAARRELTQTPVRTPGGSVARSSMGTLAMRAAPHVSWRRTALGGALAMAVFTLMVTGFLAMRTSGVGPFATLMSLGKLEQRERVLVAEFSGDTALGPVLAEAARTGLSQSSVLSLVQPTTIAAALRRMEREPASRLDAALAREVARREGVNILVTGDVRPLGSGYVVTMRLVGSDSGQTLVSLQETAPSAEGLIATVGSLTTRLRERVGESLKSVRGSPRLEQVTTASLPALEKYTQGVRALTLGGDFQRGSQLLEEAIALDTGFAMAYRRLAIEIRNNAGTTGRVTNLLDAAYRHRHRLTDAERYLTEGSYFSSGPTRDAAKALAAYENLIAIRPDDYAALNNAALIHGSLRNSAKAEELYRRALGANPSAGNVYSNLAMVLYRNGKQDEAVAILDTLAVMSPTHPNVLYYGAAIQAVQGNLDSATRLAGQLRSDKVSDPVVRMRAQFALASLAQTRGQLGESRRFIREISAADSALGRPGWYLKEQLDIAAQDAWELERGPAAAARIDAALARTPLESIPLADQPLGWL